MRRIRGHRFAVPAIAAAFLLVGGGGVAAGVSLAQRSSETKGAAKNFNEGAQGVERGGAGSESAEAMAASDQFAEARTAPGIVAPGGYSAAYGQLQSLTVAGGSWSELTKR